MSPHVVSSLIGSHVDGPPAANPRPVVLQSHLKQAPADEIHDLVCVGFGPASLAIAVAVHDAIDEGKIARVPKVAFLEKQDRFAWHAGMLLSGAKMQISFIKDMATLRNPRSEFTFLNFLHKNNRLVDFTNLSTFLPARVEYEEYLRWCASHFSDIVKYHQEVVSVSPMKAAGGGPVSEFTVASRNTSTGDITTIRARNVIVAIGGQPKLPKSLPANHPHVIHSSQYANRVPKLLRDQRAPYRVAVIGAGQSAAEIFHNVQNMHPNSKTYLVMRSEFMRPSDDSPFINSIFNPSYIDTLYPRSATHRKNFLAEARATNYAVVRLELIETLYERMYEQRRELGPDERNWPHRILGSTEIVGLETGEVGDEPMRLRIRSLTDMTDGEDSGIGSVDGHSEAGDETLEVDLVIAATGYQRTSHLTMMNDIADLLPNAGGQESAVEGLDVKVPNGASSSSISRNLQVGRDYAVQFEQGKVAPGSGIWLQGCNEVTHGLSDTLLSVLATRSGEVVDSIFCGKQQK